MHRFRRALRWLSRPLALATLALLVFATAAVANEGGAQPADSLFLSPVVIYTLVVSAVTPLVGYITNSALWVNAPEPIKGLVTAIITGLATAGTEAAATNSLGWNTTTLGLIVIGELAAFRGWHPVWKTVAVQPRLVRASTRG
jgi:predicted naringenin-chalcone synthase